MRRYVLTETLIPFTVGAVLGATLGAQIYIALPTGALQGIIALIVIVMIWMPSFTLLGPIKKRFGILGFATTNIGMFVSATGTMVGPFVAGAAKTRQNHASTMAGLMAISHICKLVAFGVLGISFSSYLPLIAAMIACGVLGNFAGRFFLNKMPEHWFRRAFKFLMTALALRLLYVAGAEIGIF